MTVRGEQGLLGARAGCFMVSDKGNRKPIVQSPGKACIRSHTVSEVERHAAEETQVATGNRSVVGVDIKITTGAELILGGVMLLGDVSPNP